MRVKCLLVQEDNIVLPTSTQTWTTYSNPRVQFAELAGGGGGGGEEGGGGGGGGVISVYPTLKKCQGFQTVLPKWPILHAKDYGNSPEHCTVLKPGPN